MTRRCLTMVAIAAAFSVVLSGTFSAQSRQPDPRPAGPVLSAAKHVDGELLVKFRRGTSNTERAIAHGWAGARRLRTFTVVPDLEHVRLGRGVSVNDAIALYRAHPDVLYAEPNYVVEAVQSGQVTPNDPQFGTLWGLHNTGQSAGAPGADIHAPEAWNITTGSSSVVVAVIDSGIDYTHPDLVANMFRNTADCNTNGLDDDGNGYIDDCYGIDTVNNDSNPMDDNGHGTHTAGTIGAVGNNSIGVVGVNWNVRLMPCKFLNASGSGTAAGAIACLDYVKTMKDRGVNIVATSNSWGGSDYSQALYDAINTQRQRGILFIAAAGNDSTDNDSAVFYPAGYNLPNVIAVAATTRTDGLASFSNYGRHTVHLGAPGHEILSTTPNNTYSTFSGTSMATPHVSGVAALLKAQDPSRDWRAIKNLILAGGDTVPSLAKTITGKRLNANGALTCSNSTVTSRLLPVTTFISATVNTAIPLAELNINCANPNGPVTVTVSPGASTITLVDDGTSGDQTAGDGIYTGQFTSTVAQTYVLTFPTGDVVTVEFLALGTYFVDDTERGTGSWSAQAPWALTTEAAHSGTHAWSDSPGGAYGPNVNVSLTSPAIDLRGASAPQLTFWQRRDFAADGVDSGNVWVTTDGGAHFTFLATYSGTNLTWTETTLDLTPFAGFQSVLIYFQVISNGSLSGDGWYIDDILVKEATPSITGRVTTSTGIPLVGAGVQLLDATGSFLTSVSTNASGGYRFTRGAGTYFVRTSNGLGYQDQLYNGVPCPGANCSVSSGTPIAVTVGATTSNINFALVLGGRIAGTVTSAATGARLAGVSVAAYTSGGGLITSLLTDASGNYTTSGLPAASYFVRTLNSLGFVDQLYDRLPCVGCQVTTGTPIVLTAGTTRSVNFALGQVAVDATAWSVSAAGGTKGVTITATPSDTAWATACSGTWLTVSPDRGTGNATLTLTAAYNASRTPRTAQLTIGGRTLTVTQAGLTHINRVDFDGDGKSDVVVRRPSTLTWYILESHAGYTTSSGVVWGVSTDFSVPGDYDGDGKADVAIYRPSTGQWMILLSSTGATQTMTLGSSGDVPAPGDYDGDGKTDLAIYHPATGQWTILLSRTNTVTTVTLGTRGDLPVPDDYDGDGKTDVAIYHPATGQWTILESSTNTSTTLLLGAAGDLPVPGDYDGDGKTDIALFRPSTGQWTIRQSSTGTPQTVTLGGSGAIPVPGDYDGDGKTDVAVFDTTGRWSVVRSSTGTTLTLTWGLGTDIPVAQLPSVLTPPPPSGSDVTRASDFDGDGKSDVVVYRPSTGSWYVLHSDSNRTTSEVVPWGTSTDVAVAGDYDGDAKTDVAYYRPSTGQWVIRLSTTGATQTVTLGATGDLPVPGDYDGDGKTDIAIFHPPTGQWTIRLSSTNTTTTATLGVSGDVPVPRDYDGDGKTDLAIYHPATSAWTIARSGTGTTTTVTLGASGDLPVPGDYDGDGQADVAVYHRATGEWNILQSSTTLVTTITWGAGTDRPVPGDYDGDGITDLAVFQSTGQWQIRLSSTNTTLSVSWGLGSDVVVTNLIAANAVVAMRPKTDATRQSDYDGDGTADIVVYRPESGSWNVLQSHAGFTTSAGTAWGTSTDVPVPGDYDHDGKTDLGVYDPATGQWAILLSSTNYATSLSLAWGTSGDIPVPGDYDGDGQTDVAYFRPSTGQWSILTSSSGYTTSLVGVWGTSADRPVPGDYDGDGKTDLAFFHPATGQWSILFSGTNYTTSVTIAWGLGTDLPVPGDYDGDGKTDLAVYRPSTGSWYILYSKTNYTTSTGAAWGTSSDRPVVGDFDGDGKTDLALFTTSGWTILLSGTNYSTALSTPWGVWSDLPLPGRP